MSLINQMLKDLDARGSASEEAGLGDAHVRPVFAAAPSRSRWRSPLAGAALLALLLLVALAAMAWRYRHPSAPAAAVIAQAPASRPVSAPAPADALKRAAAPTAAAGAKAASAPPGVINAPAMARAPVAPAAGAPVLVAAVLAAPAAIAPVLVAPMPAAPVPAAGAPLAHMSKVAVPVATAPKAAPKPLARRAAQGADVLIAANATRDGKEMSSAQRAENEYRQATQLLQQGRPGDAIVSLENALRIDPAHGAARQTLIGLLLEAHRGDEARRRLREGLALDPAQPELAMLLARLEVERGDLPAAIDVLQKGVAGADGRADYQAMLAAVLQRDKRHKEAAEHYQAALRINPNNGVWWMGLGISLQADQRLREAREAFTRARNSNTLQPGLRAFVEQRLTQLPL